MQIKNNVQFDVNVPEKTKKLLKKPERFLEGWLDVPSIMVKGGDISIGIEKTWG